MNLLDQLEAVGFKGLPHEPYFMLNGYRVSLWYLPDGNVFAFCYPTGNRGYTKGVGKTWQEAVLDAASVFRNTRKRNPPKAVEYLVGKARETMTVSFDTENIRDYFTDDVEEIDRGHYTIYYVGDNSWSIECLKYNTPTKWYMGVNGKHFAAHTLKDLIESSGIIPSVSRSSTP